MSFIHTSPSFPEGAQCDKGTEAEYRASRDNVTMLDVIRREVRPHTKPCPWCAVDILPPRQVHGRWAAGCENDECGVTCEAAGSTSAEALKLWNARL